MYIVHVHGWNNIQPVPYSASPVPLCRYPLVPSLESVVLARACSELGGGGGNLGGSMTTCELGVEKRGVGC